MNNIEILEEFIKSMKNFNNYADNTNVSLINNKPVEAIENLIQENKELKEKLDVMRRKIYRLEEDNMELLKKDGNTDKTNYKYIECPKVEAEWYKSESYIKDNYISKDKIREKIEWIERNILENDYASDEDCDIAEYQVQALQELLEERGEQ